MDTLRVRRSDSEFEVLDLTARLAFESSSSLSLDLGRWDTHCVVFTLVGWIDIHHPCDGHIKTHIRVCIPSTYHEFDQMTSIIDFILEVLSIPPDETYEAVFIARESQESIEQATDRDGFTDRTSY